MKKMVVLVAAALLVSMAASAADPAATPAGEAGSAPAGMPGKSITATVEKHILLKSGDVKWVEGPASLPHGAKMAVIEGDPAAPDALFTIRIKLPNGYKIAAHSHPADEHVTVISGTFNMGMGNAFDKKATTALAAGSFAVMPKGHRHFAWAKGETVVQVHGVGPWGINYVNPADDPRNTAKSN